MITLLRALKPQDHVLLRYYQLLVGGFSEAPFFERNDQVVWVQSQEPVLSVLPLLIHGAGHLTILHLTEVVSEIDIVVCIQHWMDCLEKGFQDQKLKTKSSLANWLPISLNALPSPQQVPKWSGAGSLVGTQLKKTKEPPLVTGTFAGIQKEAQEVLSPSVLHYIRMLQKPQSVLSCIRGYLIGRAISNDGTYFASVPEITIDKAVLPRIEDHVLKTMRPSLHLETGQVLQYQQASSPEFYSGFKFLKRVSARWQKDSAGLLSRLNFEIVPFLTTSSAGALPDGAIKQFATDRRLRAAGKKRVIAFVEEAADYLNIEKFRARLADPVFAVERTQILRRARAVAGVNNP